LDKLPKKDARLEFIHNTLKSLRAHLAELGSTMLVKYGKKLLKNMMCKLSLRIEIMSHTPKKEMLLLKRFWTKKK